MVHLTDVDGFAATLKAALDPDPVPTPGPDDKLAAVLALLILGGDPSLVFTVRATTLSRHAGEISFPGGLQDPGESLRETAVREAHEEIGLDPAEPLVLGALPALHTVVSGILVVPFVGTMSSLPDLVPSEAEIDEILVFSLEDLAHAERVVELDKPGGGVWRGFAYDVGGKTVWGATAWMVHALLDMIRRETSWGI